MNQGLIKIKRINIKLHHLHNYLKPNLLKEYSKGFMIDEIINITELKLTIDNTIYSREKIIRLVNEFFL